MHLGDVAKPGVRISPEPKNMNTLLNSAARMLCAATLCLAAGTAAAQTAAPLISCNNLSENVCDKINNMNVQFVIDGIDEADMKDYSRLVVTYEDGKAQTQARFDCKNDIVNFKTTNISIGTLAPDMKNGVASRTLRIVRARFENSTKDTLALSVAAPASITWNVYSTPVASDALTESDPARLSILNDSKTCGFETTLETGSAWADISTFEWTVADNTGFSIVPDGANAFLSQKRTEGGVYSSSVKTTTVYVKQTVGGTCSATYSKQITLLGRPEVSMGIDETAYPDGAVLICSSADDADDPGRDFSGWVAANGTVPMSITLTNGDKFPVHQAGRQAFRNAHVDKAGRVTVKEAVDANGCVTNSSTPDLLFGGVSVYDRKPAFSFPADSVYTETTSVTLNGEPESDADFFRWGVMSQFSGYNAGVGSAEPSAVAWSNMQGKVGFYAIEIVPRDGDLPECPSDTANVFVYFDMPLRYPNAISPNADGKNDKLVIERLPASNQIFVFDSRGKKVYEKTDYRNKWGAEDLEDGYYVYVLKGEGIKTIKETLAVKRTTN